MTIQIGTALEEKGKIVRGSIDLIDYPTGGKAVLPVIIASGVKDGPTFLITGNVHGNESIGIVITHRLIEELDVNQLNGRIVCIPSLNPTGTLLHTRHSLFDKMDPNRAWPSAKKDEKESIDKDDWLADIVALEDQLSPQEAAWARIHEMIKEVHPDFHIDLHTCSTLSIPYSFIDRVLYYDDIEEANNLHKKTMGMVNATGLTVIADGSAPRYVKYKLFRSTSGSSLNRLRIPATTFELGPKNDVDPGCRDAAIKALRNIMRWAEMLDDDVEIIDEVPVIISKEMYRELNYPYATMTGVYDYLKNPGDFIKEGDILATIRNIQGEKIGDLISEVDGYIMAYWPGITKYKGESLGLVAAPDRLPFVVNWNDL